MNILYEMRRFLAMAVALGFTVAAIIIYITAVWYDVSWTHSPMPRLHWIEQYIEGSGIALGALIVVWATYDAWRNWVTNGIAHRREKEATLPALSTPPNKGEKAH